MTTICGSTLTKKQGSLKSETFADPFLYSEINRPTGDPMGYKAFISFKIKDVAFKDAIKETRGLDLIDKSLKGPTNSTDVDDILQRNCAEYLADSTVTLHQTGTSSLAQPRVREYQKWDSWSGPSRTPLDRFQRLLYLCDLRTDP